MTRLATPYQSFLDAQTHVRQSTIDGYRRTLARFPRDINNLTPSWFRKRMRGLSADTIHSEWGLAVRVLQHHGRDISEWRTIRLPRREPAVTVEDLYSREELASIFNGCRSTRDRALFEVLYESACRANELLSMKIENITFSEDGTATIIVSGKTGTREIPIFRSVPALKAWLNVHPFKNGDVWVKLPTPHPRLNYSGLYALVDKIIKASGFRREKKHLLHMFRHTRITELVKLGIRGQSLSRLVGWTRGSNMESVYVHLSTTDVENEVRSKVFGLEESKDSYVPLLSSTKCPRCGTENDQGAMVCTVCSMPLSDDAILRALERTDASQAEKIEQLEKNVRDLTTAISVLKRFLPPDGMTLNEYMASIDRRRREEDNSD